MTLRTQRRRRRENKTDYQSRMALLKSGLARIVIRRTNRYFIAQIVKSEEAKDQTVLGVNSKDLLEFGWDEKLSGSLKSIPAGYLTGYLLAKKAKKGDYIVDLGMTKKHNGGRVYSVIAGLIDGGLKLKANEKIFPSKERLNGEHLQPKVKEMITKVKEKLK